MPFVIDARMKRYHQLSFLIAAALLLACGVAIVFFRRHALAPPPPSRPQSIPPVVVDIKPVSPKATSVAEAYPGLVSAAIAAICGADPATADRYEARNDALRSIMRERHLPTNDVAAVQLAGIVGTPPLREEESPSLVVPSQNRLED